MSEITTVAEIEEGDWTGIMTHAGCPHCLMLRSYWDEPGYYERHVDLTQDLDDYIRLLLKARRIVKQREELDFPLDE